MIQSQTSFESGGKTIRLDCFLPSADGQRFPTVIGLYGFGGGSFSMAEPASQLAEQGFAVYLLHYFDRTGFVEQEKSAIVEALGKQLGAKVEAETSVDDSLIGGFVVRVGSRQFDASVKAKLDALRLALKSA